MTAYDILVRPGEPDTGASVLELPEGTSVLAAAAALDEAFAAGRRVRRIVLVVGGTRIGVAVSRPSRVRGSPPVGLDECPECLRSGTHEPGCSAAGPVPSPRRRWPWRRR
ncbi:hypothetical protein [Streptomyces acidiscabies]|uniref:hypothetical protein n=1 Tax=Streptomyces acidiscabies TaxID=42234 RepID=UPI000964B7EC|nr:hypothetical protein [Streptomyces acidiscabies]GAV37380.1 hypothetical protein Saa2_00253 [Streptomyces acidiscabies]